MNVIKSWMGGHRAGKWLWLGALGLAFVLSAPAAFAQQAEGRVSGMVRDVSGGVVPGASVVLRNEASGTELRASSDASGFYLINYVPVATYTLTVSFKGFKKYVLSGVHVAPSAVLEADATLRVGAEVQTVEVNASEMNLIPKTSGGMIQTINAKQIQNLSTVGRDSLELLTLLPGVVSGTGIPGVPGGFQATGGSGFQVNGGGINNFNVNGLRSDQNMVKLDNANVIDPGENGGFAVEPNMDMIQEFTVKTSGFEASQGNGGIIVDAVTKSGGSQIHGEAYYYARNAVFNANDWSNNNSGIAKPNSKFNYPGFNIGGPVRIPGTNFNKHNDKMFFFYGMELQRQLADPGTQLRTVPSEAMRNGDFSELLNPKFCTTNAQGQITGGNYLSMPCLVNDPNTGKPAPGNILPPNAVTKAGQEVLNGTFVLPNFVDPAGNSNYAAHPLYPENRIENVARIDYNLTQNTRAYLRLAQNSDHEYYPYGLWNGGTAFNSWGGDIPRVSPVVGHDSGENASLNVVQVLNSTLTNEAQFSMGAIRYPYGYADPSKVSSTALQQSLPGFNWLEGSGGSATTRTVEIPQVWGGNAPLTSTWGQGDQYNGVFGKKTTFEFDDNLSKVKGTHTLQFGFALNHTRNDQNQANVNGTLWTNSWTAGSTGNEFGDLLAQAITGYSQSTTDPDGRWRFWNYEWYAQDSWKVTRRLTLNYGARFAYMPPWYEAGGAVSNFNPALWTQANDTSVLDGIQTSFGGTAASNAAYIPVSLRGQIATGLPQSGGFPNPGVTFEPRLGFAYDVFGTGKTVIRAGGGIYETRDQGNTIFGSAQNPPFEFSSQVTLNTNVTQPGGGFAKIQSVDPYGGLGNIALTMEDPRDNHGAGSYEWNFTVDQDIGHQTILEVAYVGNVGRHLYIENQFSPIPLGGLWTPGTQLLAPGAGSSQQSFRTYQPFGVITLLHHVSDSNYNSLQMTARRNVTHGLTLLASYTYSKTLGYSGSYNGSVDPFNSRLNYGLQSYDQPQNFNISYIYQLPNLGAKHFSGNRVAGGILDNWQLSGITNFQSGMPQAMGLGTISCTGNAVLCNNTGNNELFTGSNLTWYGTDARSLVPQLLFSPQQGTNFKGVGSTWFNPGSVALPQINTLGTTELPQFLGPGSNNFDMTLFKSFNLGEHRRIEFRAAAFDIFNRSQLDTPAADGANIANITWVVPANATSLSQGHSSAVSNASPSCTGGNTYGCITNKHGHREMEFAIKLFF